MRPLAFGAPLLTFLALLAMLAACGAPCGPSRATVVRVLDGDTVELDSEARVRLLGVDAPELSGAQRECYAAEAADFTASRALGQRVTLTYGDECLDRYGRTLAFVWVGGVELGEQLVRGGYACAYSPEGGEGLATLEAEARTSRVGMWGRCAAIPCAAR